MTIVLFDATRLLDRATRGTPTGVDRVCLAYAEWLIEHEGITLHTVETSARGVRQVAKEDFRACVTQARASWSRGSAVPMSADVSADLLSQLLQTAPLDGPITKARRGDLDPPRKPRPADPIARARRYLGARRGWKSVEAFLSEYPSDVRRLYINVSHTGLHNRDLLAKLDARGVQAVAFIHDLIPITHPEYCRPGAEARHRELMENVLTHCGTIIVNSETTATAVREHCRATGFEIPTISVAHLGIEDRFLAPISQHPQSRFFVHIGTIEARKNLAFLLTVWRRLAEDLGKDAPHLVLVGRNGWENEAVLDLLERSPPLQHLVHHSACLNDAALSQIMASAKAVLAPSCVEGFDLPAVEARAMGIPLIASDISAHRELTPDAMLVDPIDGPGWMAAVRSALTDELPRQQPARPPRWQDHFRVVARALDL